MECRADERAAQHRDAVHCGLSSRIDDRHQHETRDAASCCRKGGFQRALARMPRASMRIGQVPVAVRTGGHSGVGERARTIAQPFEKIAALQRSITIARWRIQFWRHAPPDERAVTRQDLP